MADPESQPPPDAQVSGQPPGSVAVSMTYAKSPRGILKIVEFFLLLIAWTSGAACCGSGFHFFLFASVLSWIFVTLIFLAYFFHIVDKIPQINWTLSVFINSIIWGVMMLIGSSLLANFARVHSAYYLPGSIFSAIVFGFFSVVAFAFDTYVHFTMLRG